MANPFFYSEDIGPQATHYVLGEETSKHIVQVLRMKEGEKLNLTNGKGYIFSTEITDSNRKGIHLKILNSGFTAVSNKILIAISLVKNAARFEWFLEKATEAGVSHIIPLVCKRTERFQFRMDRMRKIMVSAMLQSQQAHLPLLDEPLKFDQYISGESNNQKFIAHCSDDQTRQSLISFAPFKDPVILIGPEGDFTNEEISQAMANGFKAVSLGDTRLRTETAGIVATVLLNNY